MRVSIYYTYILKSSIDGIPFYVGYGKNDRMYQHCSFSRRGKNPNGNVLLGEKIRSIFALGGEVIYTKTIVDTDRKTARAEEKRLICEIGRADLGRGPLCNLSSGGEGPGEINNDTRSKIRTAVKNFYATETVEHRKSRIERLRDAATKQVRPENIGELIRAGQNPENMRSGTLGMKMSDEHCKKLSEIHKNSEPCKAAILRLRRENLESGRLRGKLNGFYRQIDENLLTEIVDLYKKGWGYRRIHSFMRSVRGQTFSKTLIMNRIKDSGVSLRKSLTFNKSEVILQTNS